MKTLSLLLIGLLITGISFSQITVKKVTSQVAIDGQLEEPFWDLSNQISINLGGSNNTANFGVLWDDNYLYIGINVVDQTLCKADGNSWYSDGIEICIDGNYSRGTTFDQNDRLFTKPIRSYWIQEAEGHFEDVIQQWIETDEGYSMEFAIPWNNFNINPTAGMDIGFNIAINDDDDSSITYNTISQLLWIGDANYYSNPSTWGTLNLSSEATSYSADYIALLNPNGSDFCINNNTTDIHWISNGITNIDIEYSSNNGSNWNSIATNLQANSCSYLWNVTATASDQCLIRISETGNPSLSDISESVFTISAPLTAVNPLIPNTWKNFQWPYNAYYPEDPEIATGHLGNPCGPSSIARILHYWEFPIVGNDALDFTDNAGNRWTANFGATTYNYDNMPNYLPSNSTEAEYTDIATLFYHAATALNFTGGNMDGVSTAMKHFFNYKNSVAHRNDYSRAEWIELLMNELDNSRPILIAGLTSEIVAGWHEGGAAGHFYHVDGYNEDGNFHVVIGYGDYDDYYDVDSLYDFAYNLVILTGLEPNLNGKELSLSSLNLGEIVNSGEETVISWNSIGVSDIRIEYTQDNGKNWNIISNNTSTSLGSYNWTTPNISSNECKIKLTDVTDINVYDKSNTTFSIKPYELILTIPNGNNYFIANDKTSIHWEKTPVSDIQIEYTADNGSSWNKIADSIPTLSESYDWTIPNIKSSRCKIRITDISNASVLDESNTFEIGPANNAGGPYAVDDHTVLLLHFDGNLYNQSAASNDAKPHSGNVKFSESSISHLGEVIRLGNTEGSSYLSISHSEALNLENDWTIELWFKPVSFNNGLQYFLYKPGDIDEYFSNYSLQMNGYWGNNLFCYYFSGDQRIGINNGFTPELDHWYHLAFIRDKKNSQMKLIVHNSNREQISSKTLTGISNTPLTNTHDLIIGLNFDGYIDELRISNIVRDFENTTGVTETDFGNLISIYPNPAGQMVYISTPETADLAIFNLTGQKIMEKEKFSSGNIDVSTFNRGIYVIRFSCNKGVASKKLIIE